MEHALNRFNKRPPAAPEQIAAFSTASGLTLPLDYTAFLKQTNGGEGLVGPNAYLILFAVHELASLNKAYQVEDYVPGLLVFGSDGGGEAFAFNTRNNMRVVRVPFVGMDTSTVEPLADTFTTFIEYLSKQ
jgi:SMI1 / KNR4 family (SUKH-1)